MKKLVILLILLIPIKVNALENSINLECNLVNVKSGGEITCNVNGISDILINGLNANINLSSNLEYVDFVVGTSWIGDASGNKIGLYSGTNKKGNFNFGVLTLKVKANVFDSNEFIKLTNCHYVNEEFNKVNLSDVKVDIRVASSNNKLSSLEILPGTISFNPDILDYSVSVDSPSVNISAVKEDNNSLLSGDIGSHDLDYGLNTFKINVTSESGEVRIYTINVTRIDNRSSENRLSSLSVNGKKINFNENVYNYDLSVDYEDDNIKVNASLKDNSSSFVKGYEPGSKSLKEGLNKFEIKVLAENGSIKTYTINVTRKEDPDNTSDDTYLDEIKVNDSMLDFSKEQEEYKMSVSNDVDSIKIDVVTSSSKSRVDIIGNDNLQVGENIVTIRVTALNGSVREYKIIVLKKDKEENLSNNNYLKSLEISGYKIDFDKDKLKYNLNIKDEDIIDIKATSEDSNSNVTIKGNDNLKNNSVIEIIVTAEDGSKRVYEIIIDKKVEINYLALVIVIETLIILGIIAFLIIRKKRNNGYEETSEI